jgi:hypothetical protein
MFALQTKGVTVNPFFPRCLCLGAKSVEQSALFVFLGSSFYLYQQSVEELQGAEQSTPSVYLDISSYLY